MRMLPQAFGLLLLAVGAFANFRDAGRVLLQADHTPALGAAATSPDLYYPENTPSDPTFAGRNVGNNNTYGVLNNVITDWNLAASEASRVSGYDAPRLLSLVHLAQLLSIEAAGDLSADAQHSAAGFAAHFVLAQLLPQYLNDYDGLLAEQLQNVSLADAQQAASLGEGISTSLLQNRTNDGSQRFVQVLIQPGSGPPGAYQYAPNQTFPRNMNKANATSFLIPVATLGEELNATLLTANPVGSDAYNADLTFTRDYGGSTSTLRTPDQIRIAKTWHRGISVHWNQIALAALPADTDLLDTAGLFAMLNVALFDGRIAYFTIKYRDLTWRPITAIRLGDAANPPVPGWTPYLPTVPEPEFPSGHSTLSGTAAAVLAQWFGTDEVDFEIGGEGPQPKGAAPVPPHAYTSFSSVVKEVSLARQLEGVHFKRATDVGELVGGQVGNYVAENFETLVRAFSTLPRSLATPSPSISQPIYNLEAETFPAGFYATVASSS